MYISTRELLGQTTSRAANTAVIESHSGPNLDLQSLLKQPILGPILNQLGAEALTTEALQMLAAALQKAEAAKLKAEANELVPAAVPEP